MVQVSNVFLQSLECLTVGLSHSSRDWQLVGEGGGWRSQRSRLWLGQLVSPAMGWAATNKPKERDHASRSNEVQMRKKEGAEEKKNHSV